MCTDIWVICCGKTVRSLVLRCIWWCHLFIVCHFLSKPTSFKPLSLLPGNGRSTEAGRVHSWLNPSIPSATPSKVKSELIVRFNKLSYSIVITGIKSTFSCGLIPPLGFLKSAQSDDTQWRFSSFSRCLLSVISIFCCPIVL